MNAVAWVLPVFLCFIFWGMWGFIPKWVSSASNVSPYAFLLCECIGSALMAIVLLIGMKFQVDISFKIGALAIGAGIFGMLGVLAYYMAISKGPFSIIAVATAMYPILSIGLAYIFLGEKVNMQQGIGIVLAFIAIALISSGTTEEVH